MLYMVIERFANNDMIPVYQHLRDHGRGVPEGVRFVDSWVELNFARCFQLMECNDPGLLQEWILHWRGTGVTFEVIPVVPSATTRELVVSRLENQT